MCLWKFSIVQGHLQRALWSRHGSIPDREVKSGAHEGRLLYYNTPDTRYFVLVFSTLTFWLLGQRGPAKCWLSTKDERRQPIFDRKTYPLSWLNPVGLFNQNSGLIAKMNNAGTEMEASEMIDMEGENTSKRNSFKTKRCQAYKKFSLLSFKGCPPPPSGQKDPWFTVCVPVWATFGSEEGMLFF